MGTRPGIAVFKHRVCLLFKKCASKGQPSENDTSYVVLAMTLVRAIVSIMLRLQTDATTLFNACSTGQNLLYLFDKWFKLHQLFSSCLVTGNQLSLPRRDDSVISPRKIELVALLLLCNCCHVTVSVLRLYPRCRGLLVCGM